MARYYFNLFNSETVMDREGTDFPDRAAAMEKATIDARYMAAQSVMEGELNLHHRIEVKDEQGETVADVRFGDVVQVRT